MLDRERAARQARPEPHTDSERPDEGCLVLVAEDDEAARAALLEILVDAGYRALGVADGLALLEAAPRLRPSVIVADLAMPGLDGIEAASALRRDPRTEDARIVAVTASWLADRGDLLAAAGFDAALRKPFTAERFLTELRRVLARDPLAQGVLL